MALLNFATLLFLLLHSLPSLVGPWLDFSPLFSPQTLRQQGKHDNINDAHRGMAEGMY